MVYLVEVSVYFSEKLQERLTILRKMIHLLLGSSYSGITNLCAFNLIVVSKQPKVAPSREGKNLPLQEEITSQKRLHYKS